MGALDVGSHHYDQVYLKCPERAMDPSGRLPALRNGERAVRQIDNSPAPCGLTVSSGNSLRLGFGQVSATSAEADDRPLRALDAPIRCAAATPGRAGSPPLIHVLIPRDVVLAEVGAGLDLDEDDVQLAGVLEAVDGAEGDVDGLVL